MYHEAVSSCESSGQEVLRNHGTNTHKTLWCCFLGKQSIGQADWFGACFKLELLSKRGHSHQHSIQCATLQTSMLNQCAILAAAWPDHNVQMQARDIIKE